MSFLYFMPGLKPGELTDARIDASGLRTALRDCLAPRDLSGSGVLAQGALAAGPSGQSGLLLAAHWPDGQAFAYLPEEQQWLCCGPFWLGWSRTQPPTPVQLARPLMVSGQTLGLGDGHEWTAPTIRFLSGETALPSSWGQEIGPGGTPRFRSEVLPEYDWAWRLTGTIWDAFLQSDPIPYQRMLEWCSALLSVNYRIGPWECTALRLITSQNAVQILRTAIEGDKAIALLNEEQLSAVPPVLVETDPKKEPGSAAGAPIPPPPESISPG